MALRVGIDLVDVESVEASLRSHEARYLRRVYTGDEVDDCRIGGRVDARRLAARFAAKEATLKVLEPADEAVPWQTIEVRRRPTGVALELSGAAAALARDASLGELVVSLTHEGGCAAAVVIALS